MIKIGCLGSRYSLLMVSVIVVLTSSAQSGQNDPGFIPPMDIDLVPSGNFAEFRGGHFHSGVDLKTKGVSGFNIYAVQDGYVSRVKVSPWGYGKAIYIDHPSGHTTVYAHLSKFSDPIAEYVLKQQYAQRKFGVDLYLKPGTIPVKQGEIIGKSGNSGGSTAPHLHYEVRRASDQVALDPEAFGLKIPDTTPPLIKGVRLYPLDDNSKVSPYKGSAKGFLVEGASGRYRIRAGQYVGASGMVGIGIHARGKYDNSGNLCGVRKIELYVDDELHFTVDLSTVNFGTTRFLNAHMDHRLYNSNRMHYHKCFKRGNNKLNIYKGNSAMGGIMMETGRSRKVKAVLYDPNGISSTLEFVIEAPESDSPRLKDQVEKEGMAFKHGQSNHFGNEKFSVDLGPKVLYNDLVFTTSSQKGNSTMLSDQIRVGDQLDEVQSKFQLTIKPTKWLKGQMDKVLIVRKDSRGRLKPKGGLYSNQQITARVRDFGTYFLMADTTAPTAQFIDLKKDMRGRKNFSIRIGDNLSGIDQWKATLDGKWILMDYEPKQRKLTHTFDQHSEGSGERIFKFEIIDDRGNKTVKNYTFTR